MAETYKDILASASTHLSELSGHVFDLLTVEKPISIGAAVNLSKVISKLSPLLGNLIEFNTVEFLNGQPEYKNLGTWFRQDPGFPDTIFISDKIEQTPGFEIKAWFPLATEITARFKDSQNHFSNSHYVPKRAILNGIEVFTGSIGGSVTHICVAFSARRAPASCFLGLLGSFRAH